MDRSPAVVLLLVNSAVLVLCGAVVSLWTALWAGMLVAAALDPSAPSVLLVLFGGGLVLRLALLLTTALAVLFSLAAAASLSRGERRFVLVASVCAILVPLANLALGAVTFDVLACVWGLQLILGVVTAVFAMAGIQGTDQVRQDEW